MVHVEIILPSSVKFGFGGSLLSEWVWVRNKPQATSWVDTHTNHDIIYKAFFYVTRFYVAIVKKIMEITFPLGLISLTKVQLCEYSQREKSWAIKHFYFSLKKERPIVRKSPLIYHKKTGRSLSSQLRYKADETV